MKAYAELRRRARVLLSLVSAYLSVFGDGTGIAGMGVACHDVMPMNAAIARVAQVLVQELTLLLPAT